ncbi:MAG TPA: T9SS type A sorting domain-containing protein [Bacteroidales bacterium]|nr:T9SS type A sorting domain-containing protein [Bacteroidales bacterium]
MKTIRTCLTASVLLLLIFTAPLSAEAQTQLPMPAHSSVYANIYARGYWFVAPVNFTITGLMVAPEAGTGLQYIHVMKCTGVFPISASTPGSPLFTTLTYISGAPNNVMQNVSIPVLQGDQIGILGTVTGIANSYASSAIVTSTIGGQSVYLNRFGYQGSIETGPAPGYWGVGNGTSGQIGRVHLWYSLAGKTDASIDSLVFPADSSCAGTLPVQVRMKNYGPQPLVSAQIQWKINSTPQVPFSWTGNIPINGDTSLVIGNYQFHSDTVYNLMVNTSNPNNYADTANANDTLHVNNLDFRPSPKALFSSTTYTVCAGDSIQINGTLSGVPPWNITLKQGTNQYQFNNLTTPSFSFFAKPVVSAWYLVTSVTDGGGCPNTSATDSVQVLVSPAPPAAINPVGSPAACFGDSVSLMASVGLNFTYNWFKNGVQIPGAQTYAYHAKEGGNYTVEVTSPNGCKNTSAPFTVTIHPLPVVNLGNDTVLLLNKNLPLNAGAGFTGYVWSTGATGQFVTIDTANTGTGLQTVWVMVTDNNGCVGSDTLKINFTNNPGIANTLIDNSFSMVPNPTTGLVEINMAGYDLPAFSVEIYHLDGRLVYQAPGPSGETIVRLNLEHLASGHYQVKISSAKITLMQRLIIQK